jgi:oxygen-independent coproporphyrinogen-3 oxidase
MPGLYIHIPFCEKKCVYCDFYSIEGSSMMGSFLKSLSREINLSAQFGQDRVTFETIYFGGGTPSLLSPSTVAGILDTLHRRFQIARAAEITLEVNPGTVDSEKLREFRQIGVNRLSVGIQSFHDHELKFLGRIHSAGEAKACVRSAQELGYNNVSLDLIFALPGQDLQDWEDNLSTAMSLSPQHVSAYSLIVEEGTPLARMVGRGEVHPTSEEAEAEMYLLAMEYLAAHGFEHYEVSNYARHGFHSRHNSLYWNHDSYLSFGPSAHSFWSGEPFVRPTRWWNVASIGRYCGMLAREERPIQGEESLTRKDLLTEEIFLGLRSGRIDNHRLKVEYGTSLLERYAQKLERFVEERLLMIDRGIVRLTPKGFLLCDGIALELST